MSAPPEDQTVALGPADPASLASLAARPSGSSIGGTGTLSAPLEALDRDEIRRTRWFCYVSFTISLVAGASLRWLDGDPAATALLLGALAASVLATAFML